MIDHEMGSDAYTRRESCSNFKRSRKLVTLDAKTKRNLSSVRWHITQHVTTEAGEDVITTDDAKMSQISVVRKLSSLAEE